LIEDAEKSPRDVAPHRMKFARQGAAGVAKTDESWPSFAIMTATAASDPALPSRPVAISIIGGAALLMCLGMGMRQSLGLFMVPITGDLGLSVSDFTFALALQNIIWGITQPFVGALADRYGVKLLMIGGSLCFTLGILGTIFATGALTLMLSQGVLIGVSLSCTASNLSLTSTARVVTAGRRSLTLGLVAAIGSFGTFIVAPLAQKLIVADGWHVAMTAFLALTAIMLPAALLIARVDKVGYPRPRGAAGTTPESFASVLRTAAHHRGYVTMSVAFFVCGLQLIFLTTHLPTYLALCGQDPMLSAKALATVALFNVMGCYLLGWLGGRYPKPLILGIVYVARSFAIAAYFVFPPTPFTTLVFAAVMGLLWLGVAPLVQGLVAQMFGLRYLATLSGIAFFFHQVGSFVGAWGGGLIYDRFGSYDHAWQFGVAIGLVAGCAQILTNDQPSRPVLRPVSA
jgi:predicted MFS family arabinose efflux permease